MISMRKMKSKNKSPKNRMESRQQKIKYGHAYNKQTIKKSYFTTDFFFQRTSNVMAYGHQVNMKISCHPANHIWVILLIFV